MHQGSLSQLFRQLADMIDAKQQAPEPELDSQDYLSEPDSTGGEDCGCSDQAEQPDDLFVPPLQLKMELLKKAVGVENIYDDGEEEDCESHSYGELEAIKRNAGLIDPVVMSELGDDEPLES